MNILVGQGCNIRKLQSRYTLSFIFSPINRRPRKSVKKLSGVVSKPVQIPGSHCIYTTLPERCSP